MCYILATIVREKEKLKMFNLMPREAEFFRMFQEMAHCVTEGAVALKDMLDHFSAPEQSKDLVKNLEERCGLQTHAIIRKLNRSFITPFDREDIYALASSLDDIIDSIKVATQHLLVYNIVSITSEAKMLGSIVLKACQTVEEACGAIEKHPKQISEFCAKINLLEHEADGVRAEAISRLFKEEIDPIQLIKWKEIYENLEFITDKCEGAGNILESIVLKNG